MIDKKNLETIDKSEMYKIYDKWPRIAKESFEKNYEKMEKSDIDHVVFVGMGGSGSIGDVFGSILSKTDIHITNVKGYLLPKTVHARTLVVITSVSGNTIESLTVLESAMKLDCKIIAFTSGGKMEKICKENNIDFRRIEQQHSPRVSLVSYLYAMLNVFEIVFSINKQDVLDSIIEMENTQKIISSDNLNESNSAIELAKWIKYIPMIYYPFGLEAVAVRFKSCLQENAKSHAIVEDVIEAGHNGIVAWEVKSTIQPILLTGSDDFIKTKDRWGIIKGYFQENSIDFKEVKSLKGNILSKIINLIYLLDYATIYLAILSKIDPTTVKSIEYIKKRS